MFRPTPATEGDSDSSLSTSFSTSFSSVSRIGAMLRNEQTTYAHYDYFGGKCKCKPQPQPNTARTRTRTRTRTATATATTNTNTNANTNTNTNTNRSTAAIAINQSCRYLMARWCIRLCRFCECENVVATAAAVMSCVDRFVALTQQQQQLKQQQQQLKQQQQQCQGMDTDADAAVVLAFLQRDPIRCYQLVVVTAWYTVTKIRQPFAVDPDSMERLSHGNCTRSDIERTEVELLATLGWAVHPPTPSEFAREFAGRLLLRRTITATTATTTTTTTTMAMATMATATTTATMATTTATATITKLTAEERVVRLLLELVDCQLEHVVSDYELSCLHRPSFVAFGALWNAMVGLGWAGDESHSHSDSDLDSDLDIDIDSADHANFNVNVNANASWKSLKERLLLPELGNSNGNGNGNGSDNDNDLDAELWRSVTSIRTLLGTVFALEESSGGISGGGSRDSSNRDSSNSFSSSDGGCHLVTRPLALLVERCCGSSNSSSNGCSNSNSNGCSPCSHDHQRNHQHNNHNHQHTMELSSSPAPKTSTRSELPPSPSVGGPFPSPRTVAR